MITLLCALCKLAHADARQGYQLVVHDSAGCIATESLEAAVAARLGYDPFTETAQRVIEVELRSAARRVVEGAVLIRERDRLLGQKPVRAEGCLEVAGAIELAISLAIDPLGTGAASPLTTSQPSPTSSPHVSRTVLPTSGTSLRATRSRADVEVASTWLVTLALNTSLSLGMSPSVALGGSLRAGISTHSLSLWGEVLGHFPTSNRILEGRLHTASVMGVAAACLPAHVLDLCALVRAGAIQNRGSGFDRNQSFTRPYLAAGPRVGLRLHFYERWSVQGTADLTFSFIKTNVTLDQRVVWTTPLAAATFGLGLGLDL